MDLATLIRDVPDFPVPGILFKDITTLLQEPEAFRQAVDAMVEPYVGGPRIDLVAAIESRGFILGAPMAYRLGAGFVPIRKQGKLPADKVSADYTLEYGVNTLEMHADAIRPGQTVLVVDDLLATGGSARAAVELVEKVGGKVIGLAFLVELASLQGVGELEGYPVFSVIRF